MEVGCPPLANAAWWAPGDQRHRLLLTRMPLDTLLVAAACAYREAAYKLTSLIVLGNLIVVLGAVSIGGRSRCRGNRPVGRHRLCSAAIASCSTWSRHVAAIGRPPGGWEGLQAKGPGGAEGWTGGCGAFARNYSLHALDGIIGLRNQAMRGAPLCRRRRRRAVPRWPACRRAAEHAPLLQCSDRYPDLIQRTATPPQPLQRSAHFACACMAR